MTLQEENEQLKIENTALKGQLTQALERMAQLEAQLNLNSHNSSKPPSSDVFVRPSKKRSLRKASGKKPGAQPGHAGHTLSWNETLDQIVEHLPQHCSECQAALAEVKVTGWQSHQDLDLPLELKLITTHHRSGLKECPHCPKMNQFSKAPVFTIAGRLIGATSSVSTGCARPLCCEN